MYTVLLGQLPPKKYATFEQAWGCYYLDARRGCICWGRGECRCERFEEIKALLAEHGAVGLHAAVIYTGDTRPAQMWHMSMRRLLPIKAEVYGDEK